MVCYSCLDPHYGPSHFLQLKMMLLSLWCSQHHLLLILPHASTEITMQNQWLMNIMNN
jgi:hypothetical protein